MITHYLSQSAKVLGKEEDYAYFKDLAQEIKDAIHKEFYNAETGIYASGTQTELSLPLLWGLVDESQKAKVAAQLARKVEADGRQMDVGVLGAKALLNTLSENGYAELAYALASKDTYPSWGWWIRNGATTLLENWDLDAQRDISDNHMMFGEIGAWMFKALGGLKPDPENPGFAEFSLQPAMVKDLDNVHMYLDSPKGRIALQWTRKARQVWLEVTVPPNSLAHLKWDTNQFKTLEWRKQTHREGYIALPPGTHQLVYKP